MAPLEGTITAIATPLGQGGLAVIRISGPEALAIADKVFRPRGKKGALPSTAASHTIHYGEIQRDQRVIDEVLLAVMRAPRTFTREDVIEISCHGGILTAKLVLDAILDAGARMAGPGEFTRRAFLNGRIDLTQAEAVADLIAARSDLALAAANEQLAGSLSRRIETLRGGLMGVLAHVEAHIDFPDEDIAPDTRAQLILRLREQVEFMESLLRTAGEGQILRRGIRAAIVGRPNAGKSSLLNQLLGHDRAIVSPVAGTTRDTIEETANVRGLPVIFIDTAGLRDSTNEIEAEGIRRTRLSVERADIILHVLDASELLAEQDAAWIEEFGSNKRILVLNKTDLPRRAEVSAPASAIGVSCATGSGMEELKDAIRNLVWSGKVGADMSEAMINSRHEDALRRAKAAAIAGIRALEAEESVEFAALELRIATQAVGEIIGKTTTEDLLDSIFSQFCIGK